MTMEKPPSNFSKLYDQGEHLAATGNLRAACDKFLDAVQCVPDSDKWAPYRFKPMMMHTMILRELHFPATSRDIKTLTKKFLFNPDEPPHYRVVASFAVGVLESNAGNREKAAEAYREGLDVAKSATAEERQRTVSSDDGPLTVGYLLDVNVKTIASNLSLMEGGPRLDHTSMDLPRDFGDQSRMPPIGGSISYTKSKDNANADAAEDRMNLFQRATVVGGSVCDKCGKSAEEARLLKLMQCTRCKMAYYCSKECQVKSWKGGHKKACRKPNQIEVGDDMVVRGIASETSLNGSLCKIIGPDPEKLERWRASVGDRTISLASEKLKHIRPAM